MPSFLFNEAQEMLESFEMPEQYARNIQRFIRNRWQEHPEITRWGWAIEATRSFCRFTPHEVFPQGAQHAVDEAGQKKSGGGCIFYILYI